MAARPTRMPVKRMRRPRVRNTWVLGSRDGAAVMVVVAAVVVAALVVVVTLVLCMDPVQL
jgi:hypothetical protein